MKIKAKLKGRPTPGRDLRFQCDQLQLDADTESEAVILAVLRRMLVSDKFPGVRRSLINASKKLVEEWNSVDRKNIP